MNVIKEEGMKVHIKSWCNSIEPSALEQAKNVASLPFVHRHVSLMPDCHAGYGTPIGTVAPLTNVIIPFLIGVDIGCGMLAVQTSLTEITTEQLKRILGGSKEYQGGIRSSIPVGMKHRSKKCDYSKMPQLVVKPNGIVTQEYDSARYQMGTLGGGNHFIEIQHGDGNIWFMIHSGSRNLGYKVANHYCKLAKELNAKWYSQVPKEWDLAFLPVGSSESNSYLREMNYCLEFAKLNREYMQDTIEQIFKKEFPDIKFEKEINIHHNYATQEHHFGKNVWVHRKGATSARKGQLGIIPGSQGTSSYIVEGLGNPESFTSCSHGAGRAMSRTKARNELSLEHEQALLDGKGILHSIHSKANLDEASSAYKPIETVMKEQEDLVKIVTKLEPLAVVKG